MSLLYSFAPSIEMCREPLALGSVQPSPLSRAPFVLGEIFSRPLLVETRHAMDARNGGVRIAQ